MRFPVCSGENGFTCAHMMASEEDTKETVVLKLGKPDNIGGQFGKNKIPLIQKFGGIEFHYDLDGRLRLVFQESEGAPYLCVPFGSQNT